MSSRKFASNISSLENASISFSSLEGGSEEHVIGFFGESPTTPGGSGILGIFLIVSWRRGGGYRAEPEVSLWDLAPLAVLVTEAGAVYVVKRCGRAMAARR